VAIRDPTGRGYLQRNESDLSGNCSQRRKKSVSDPNQRADGVVEWVAVSVVIDAIGLIATTQRALPVQANEVMLGPEMRGPRSQAR
jgi:hypothetical protein